MAELDARQFDEVLWYVMQLMEADEKAEETTGMEQGGRKLWPVEQ